MRQIMMAVRCRLVWALGLLMVPHLLSAQGTQADYRRAARLREAVRQTVFRDRVDPQWLTDSRFWYRVEIGKLRHEYVVVDAVAGQRRPLFDSAQLAAALSQRLSRNFQADALPLGNLEVDPELQFVRFTVDRQRLHYDLSHDELTEMAADEADGDALRLLREIPRASRTTGAESEVVFVNQSPQNLRLYWRDTSGRRVAYGTVAAGQEHRQHTFAGHVWELATQDEQPCAGFVAATRPGRAVVPADVQPLATPRPSTADPHRSPDGLWTVRIENFNVVLRRLTASDDQPPEIRLTRDGTADDSYAGPVFWSPDSQQFVIQQTRKAQSHPIHLIESSPQDRLEPKLQTLEYLKPGDQIAHPRPRLFDVAQPQPIPISEDLFPEPWSLREFRWDADSERFSFVYNQRGHQVLRVIAVDRKGQVSVVVEERSDTFIDYNSKYFLQRLDSSGELLWMSERDGWNHLWRYDAQAGTVKGQVTQGPWLVRRVEHVDEQQRQVWFYAAGIRPEQDPYHIHLCRVNFDGSGLVILTSGDGTHEVTFSPDRAWLIDQWSRVDQPPVTELRRASDGALVFVLETADHQALLATGWSLPERFVAMGRDGATPIYGLIIRPSNVEPSRMYPIVEQIYAGPHGAHVPKSFGLLLGQHAMAELGFIVVQIDGMGTNWRSKRFHDVCWQNLADSGFPDRIAWIRAAAQSREWMDVSRVGIYGGSAGGQSAMRALLDHHDFYKVAVADCGCHDNRMDKIWWNELWMGYPVGTHYEASSNAVNAHRLQGRLLLIVGELDRNVDPASTLQVAAALQRADKDFDLVIVAGAGHGAAETAYGSRRRSDFLVRHLHGREPRQE